MRFYNIESELKEEVFLPQGAESKSQRQRTTQRRHGSSSSAASMSLGVSKNSQNGHRRSSSVTSSGYKQQQRQQNLHTSDTPTQNRPMNKFPMPIQFLVREQAKSLVAIRALKDRVQNLEEVQEEVFETVHELQYESELRNNLTSSSFPDTYHHTIFEGRKVSVPPKNSVGGSKASDILRPLGRFEEVSEVSAAVKSKKGEFAKGDAESENKQDSGVDSDCPQLVSMTNAGKALSDGAEHQGASAIDDHEPSDEMSFILDAIARRGILLRQQAESAALRENCSPGDVFSYQDPTSLLQNCKVLQKRLRDTQFENDGLCSRIDRLDMIVNKLQLERSLLEDKLEHMIKEKHCLKNAIQDLQKKFQRSEGSPKTPQPSPLKSSRRSEDHYQKQLLFKRQDGGKEMVASILKETNILELQRQLLTCVFENEVLSTKLEYIEKEKLRMEREKIKTTEHRGDPRGRLTRNAKKEQLEKEHLAKLCRSKMRELAMAQTELDSAQGKVHQLEKDLQSMNNTTPANNCNRTEVSNCTSDYNHDNPKHKFKSCQSLPVLAASNKDFTFYREEEVFPLQNTSGYLNITASEYLEDLQEENSDTEMETNRMQRNLFFQRCSTPIHSSSAKKFEFPAEDTSHFKRPNPSSQQLKNVCEEFDPLSTNEICWKKDSLNPKKTVLKQSKSFNSDTRVMHSSGSKEKAIL